MFHDHPIDDWVAVEVKTDSGRSAFFVTWGRIQDPVDPRPLEELTLRVATQFSIGGRPLSARVCASLREAASQPYFYEALLTFAHRVEWPRNRGGYGRLGRSSPLAHGSAHERLSQGTPQAIIGACWTPTAIHQGDPAKRLHLRSGQHALSGPALSLGKVGV